MVLGRKEVSVLLLAAGAFVVFSAVLVATTTEAQQGSPGTNCEEVASIGPETTNQRVGPLQIEGNTIRVQGEVTADDPDRFSALSINVDGEGEDGLPAFDIVSITETGPFTENILEGPGSFTFDVEATEAVTYTLDIFDCGASPAGGASTPQGGQSTPQTGPTPASKATQKQKEKVIRETIPKKPLPPTGGMPAYVMMTGAIFAGVGLLGVGFVVRQRPRR